MKTETQIAQENIKWFKKNDEDDIQRGNCLNHKATCQRFLEFLEEEVKEYISDIGELGLMKPIKVSEANIKHKENRLKVIGEKITDLKQAIKLYNEAGI